MKNVCVITGGGSGMGLATAKIMGRENHIIIVGRTIAKLENAVRELAEEGIEAEAFGCDVADRQSVKALAQHAKEKGQITSVIHAAGLSPHMGDGLKIMQANALGTIYINEEFFKVMEEGSSIIDISSMSAYMLPNILLPVKSYQYSLTDVDMFLKKAMARVNLFPQNQRSGLAYCISKNFVVWYVKKTAVKFGEKGIRVVSVSPGNFETPMGELEKKEAEAFTQHSAIKRFGHVEEISELIAFCASKKASYLTGVDVLCDGGVIASGYRPGK